jgi:hemoglobin-like flavoprotein
MMKILTSKNIQNLTLTFGEKQRLFEHIALLEQTQQEVADSHRQLQIENEILNRFRYAHVTQKIEHILPQCFEDEIFMQWTKFSHLIKRCLKKCFLDGNVFNQGYMGQQSPLSAIDTE